MSALAPLLMIGTALLFGACKSPGDDELPVIELIALAPEKGNWTPDRIEVERDMAFTLVIKNRDVVTHGFYLPAFKIAIQEIMAGTIAEVRLQPRQAGSFPFYCAVWCSDYHMHMRGVLVVK